MKLIKFDVRKRIAESDPFRINEHIEQVYIDIAEAVISVMYKAYCFNPLFEWGEAIEEKTESIKSAIICWADYFMDWKINDMQQAKESVKALIYMNMTPTLGLFRAVYFNEWPLIENSIYKEYVNYLFTFCIDKKDGKIYGADFFSVWQEEKRNSNKYNNI